MSRVGIALVVGASALLGLVGASGCSTDSFCFNDCGGTGGGAAKDGGGATDGGGTGGIIPPDGSNTGGSGGLILPDGGGDACIPNPPEVCNGVDDDCNGKIDDGIDFTAPEHCGTCDLNCTQLPHTVNQTCTPPSILDGSTPGTCKFDCEKDFYDLVHDDSKLATAGCEYQCPWNPDGTNTKDLGGAFGCGRDDDCDGQVDEDVNTCSDLDNCGKCGTSCTLPHATPKCVTTATGGAACDTTNTGCEIAACDPGWYDNDKSPDNGCEYNCPVTTPGPEVCDGQDNDCNGLIDDADPNLESGDPNVGKSCFGGTSGLCIDPTHQGLSKCIGGQVTCCDPDSNNIAGANPNFPSKGVRNGVCDAPTGNQVLKPGDVQETCNNVDDNCNGVVDDNPIDAGGQCGSSVGNCVKGTQQCQSGALVCVGKIDPTPDICNGQDDNCDGVIDGTVPSGAPVVCTSNANCSSTQFCAQVGAQKQCVDGPTDASGACAPTGMQLPVPLPCKAGALACVGGVKQCQGAVGPTGTVDACGVDSNCDGTLTNQPNLQTDVKNCGSCGNNCNNIAPTGHGVWACQAGACVRTGCDTGFINCDGNNNDCEKACTFVSAQEQCNGIDDNCNCQVDENISSVPTPVQVCDVAPAATEAGCKGTAQGGQVVVACTAGAWKCTFPAGYCNNAAAPNYCSGTADTCDGKDNNCNGATDENFKPPILNQGYIGQACASDDGKPPPGDGACRVTGTYQCTGPNTTACNAVKDLTKAGPELCDAIDNDCDGLVDEPFTNKGSNATYFLKPSVTKVAANVWVYQYEASRPGATTTTPGTGNGYTCNTSPCPGGAPVAPVGSTLDKTVACSVSGKVPWFNVTPIEVEQTCVAMGGSVCTTAQWQTACQTNPPSGTTCTWGYNTRGATCTTGFTGSKYCNLGVSYDFDPVTPGIQNGLLPTASALLQNCWADWSGLLGNVAANNNIRDITGNLREITKSAVNQYPLMGGAFDTDAESGAACNFTFYTVDQNFKLFDTGFRCCFSADPTI